MDNIVQISKKLIIERVTTMTHGIKRIDDLKIFSIVSPSINQF